jgi:hypothetical protein
MRLLAQVSYGFIIYSCSVLTIYKKEVVYWRHHFAPSFDAAVTMSGDYFAEKWAQHCYRGESLVGDGKDGFQEISFNS